MNKWIVLLVVVVIFVTFANSCIRRDQEFKTQLAFANAMKQQAIAEQMNASVEKARVFFEGLQDLSISVSLSLIAIFGWIFPAVICVYLLVDRKKTFNRENDIEIKL